MHIDSPDRRLIHRAALAALGAAALPSAHAQAWPTKPISLLIPFVMKFSGASPPMVSPQRSLQPTQRATP